MFKSEVVNGVPEVKIESLKDFKEKVRWIDVRNPNEYIGELGHIEGAELVTLGPDLQSFLEKGVAENLKDELIVFVCRTGARSGQATMFSQQLGYQKVFNLQGGMVRWNALQLPIKK